MSAPRSVFAVAGAALALAGVPAVAQAGSSPRADFVLEFSKRKPATATAVDLRVVYKGPNGEGKPSPIRKVVIATPRGTRFDTGALPRCDASDEELRTQGDAACPPRSLLGTGKLTAITGFGPPVDPFRGDLSVYNYEREIVELVKDPQTGRPVAFDRLRIDRNVWTAHPPSTPGGPPDGQTAVRTIDFTLAPKAAWAITPRRCPRSRRWRSTGTFTFADGKTVTVAHTTPCRRRAPRAIDQRQHHLNDRRERR